MPNGKCRIKIRLTSRFPACIVHYQAFGIQLLTHRGEENHSKRRRFIIPADAGIINRSSRIVAGFYNPHCACGAFSFILLQKLYLGKQDEI
jgi:hypothetical protein